MNTRTQNRLLKVSWFYQCLTGVLVALMAIPASLQQSLLANGVIQVDRVGSSPPEHSPGTRMVTTTWTGGATVNQSSRVGNPTRETRPIQLLSDNTGDSTQAGETPPADGGAEGGNEGPVITGFELTPVGGDRWQARLQFEAEAGKQYVVEFRDSLDPADHCVAWRPLPGAPHNAGWAQDDNASPNRFYRVRTLEEPVGPLTVLLANDTGSDSSDGVTADPALCGAIIPETGPVWLEASVDSPEGLFTRLLDAVQEAQNFALSGEDVLGLAAGAVAEGPHTVFLRTVDEAGTVLTQSALSFTLDTTPSPIALELDPATDSLPVGDGQTDRTVVNVRGQTEPGNWVVLDPGGLSTTADENGAFAFSNLFLVPGPNVFTARVFDPACNVGETQLLVTRNALVQSCVFDDHLTGWQIRIANPPEGGTPGSVSARDCAVVLREGDSFEVELERAFTVPQGAGMLYLAYNAPSFDTTTSHAINDAFEVALVDQAGRPLTCTIQNASGSVPPGVLHPSAFPISADAVFNHTQGMDPFCAAGAEVRRRNSGGQILRVDLGDLGAGSSLRLILRLINNDRDRESAVRLIDLSFAPADATGPFAGSSGFAFSALDSLVEPEAVETAASTASTSILPAFGSPPIAPAASGSGNPAGQSGDSLGVIEGACSGRFVNPQGPANMAVIGTGTTNFAYGDWSTPNRVIYTNATFTAAVDQFFSLGQLYFYNSTTYGVLPTSFDLELNLTFAKPPGITQTFDYTLVPVGTSNDHSNPWDNADFLYMTNNLPSATFQYEGNEYTLEIFFGNSSSDGFTSIDRFWVLEYAGASADVLGRITSNIHGTTIQAPILVIEKPSDGTQRAAGTALLQGYALAHRPELFPGVYATNQIVLVTVNGASVEALDAAGNFFSPIDIRAGQNTFEVVATDAHLNSTTNTVTVSGTTTVQNWASLGVVTASAQAEYGRTTFNEWTQTLYADVAIRNVGTYPINAPLYVGITRISEASVSVLEPDGVSADGIPYYDFSATLGGGSLNSGDLSGRRALAFHNPNKVQFTYDLVILGQLNGAPSFTTVPPLEAIVGKPYHYAFNATDPDGDAVTYTLAASPAGMVLDTGGPALSLVASSDQVGTHDITIQATDGKGGLAEQHYLLSVIVPPANRPPYFVSQPLTEAQVRVPYTYAALAVDPDGDALSYALVAAPAGMTIDSGTGVVHWTPPADAAYLPQAVVIMAGDGRGGSNQQAYILHVLPADGNHPPIIVSLPNTNATVGESYAYQVVACDPDNDLLKFSLVKAPAGMIIDSSNGLILWQPDASAFGSHAQIVRVEDGRGGSDSQSVEINVSSDELGEIHGTVFSDLEGDGRNGLPQDLVVNGAFSKGNTGFYSDYEYDDALGPDGVYSIGYDPSSYHPTAYSIGDHTSGAGLMMLVNGSTVSDTVVWRETMTVVPNRIYELSFWLASWFPAVAAALRVSINGQQVGQEFIAPLDTGRWVQCVTSWKSANTNVAVIQLIDQERAFGGNDFALDDFSFATVVGSEPGLKDWVVYFDQDSNGRRDPGEQWTLSDADGHFQFLGLPPGHYRVTEERQFGWIQTAPMEGVYSVDLASGQIVKDLDFGNQQGLVPQADHDPAFVTTAPTTLTFGQVLRYRALARDPDGDALAFDLVTFPDGMLVDSYTGVVAWRPVLSQVGTHDVTLRVQDGRGGVALQSFQITVIPPNSPPVINSYPPGPAVVGLPYQYHVQALDAEGQALTFSLGDNAPAGVSLIALDSNAAAAPSAALEWTPVLDDIGTHRIEIVVRDEMGAEGTQTFDLEVLPSAPNHPPVFVSAPRLQTCLGAPYAYLARATDVDGDPLDFDLASAPAGMVLSNAQPAAFGSRLLLWTPEQLGTHLVVLTVNDGRPQGVTTQQFTINVTSTLSNQPPQFVSTPPLNATVDLRYEYDPVALDPDQDTVTWQLVSGPVGMAMDSNSGALRWTPMESQIGNNEVVIEARDAFMATARQDFSITVNWVNRPPQIGSTPPVMANVGEAYLYAPRASDPDGDSLTWTFGGSVPPGMTLDPATGLVRWTPAQSDVGVQTIRIRVADDHGAADTQSYDLHIVDSRGNHAPAIVSTPLRGASAGRPYAYTLRATDADGDALTLQPLVLPAGATLTLTSSRDGQAEALLSWTPTTGQTGLNDVILAVQDPALASAAQRFTILVRANQAPQITSNPRLTAVPRVDWHYDVAAVDFDGDPLTYTLNAYPQGMTIDALGRMAWTPTLAQVGEHAVSVTVSDGYGGSANQGFNLTVEADTQTPRVWLSLIQGLINPANGDWAGDLGSTVAFKVEASDNIGIASRSLRVGDQEIPLSSGGIGSLLVSEGGLFDVVATASDFSGNVSTAHRGIVFRDPNAESTVSITISSPTNMTEVLKPVDVVGSIAGTMPLTGYTVEVAELTNDAADMSVADPSLDYRTLAQVTLPAGTLALTDAVLARFDPTLLQNGGYLIRVTAYDVTGQGRQEGVGVFVGGNLKFGEFRLEFTDLTIPLAGIPITVKRIYDSREAGRRGDFGYGWSLGLQDAHLLKVGRKSRPGLFEEEMAFTTRTRVYLTDPQGKRVGFSYVPKPATDSDGRILVSPLFGPVYVSSFKPDPGVHETLEVIESSGEYTVIHGDGSIGYPLFNFLNYDPTRFRLTTHEGDVCEYDVTDGLQRITDPNGNRLVFTRTGIFHYPAGSTEADQSVPFIRDALGRIRQIVDPNGGALNYQYDAAGDLVRVTDQSTNATQFAYNAVRAHFLETIIDPLGHQVVRSEYDDAGRLKSITDAGGNTLTQDFDADAAYGTYTDANGNLTREYFDERGNKSKTVDPEGGVTEFGYDADDNETSRKDPRGYITTRAYDRRGNVTNIVDALSNVTSIAYNDWNKPTRITDALGHSTQFAYDARGQLTNVINALGGQASFTRDAQGRVTSVTDLNGHTTGYDYTGGCSCGKPGKVTNPDGTFRTYDYNWLGQTTKEVNELGAATVFNYDGVGILLSQDDALGNRTEYGYLVNVTETAIVPRLIKVTDPLGRPTFFKYDNLNRTNQVIDAAGGVVQFDYDANGNRTKVVDPVGNVTLFHYDKMNRLTEQIDPWGRTNFFKYDAAGNRIEAIDRNGRKRTFEYDGLNRRTKEHWWDGANVIRTIEFGFNALGVMTNASDPASHLAFEFDPLNRLAKAAQSGVQSLPDFTLTYAYDGMTNVVSTTDNWGVEVASEYDSRNRLAKRIWQGGELPGVSLAFAYDATGNRTNILRFGGTAGNQLVGQSRYAFNPVGAMTDILHENGSGDNLAEYHYARDPAQQIVQRLLNGQTADYGYDPTGQLTNALYSAGQPNEAYHYDANGNRIGGGYLVTTNNQIVADGANTYSYDLEGSMVGRSNTVTHATTDYTYDYRNRLVSVVDEDAGGVVTQTVEFTYDALNRRVAKSVNSSVTRFLLNQENIWADANGAGAITARYLLGNHIDEMLARYRTGDIVVWYLTDNLGSVRDLIGANGAALNQITYDTFGRLLYQSRSQDGDRFVFTGREWDDETQLYCYRKRYYSADLGRFISPDPLGYGPGDVNLYRYALNSPLHVTDPSGCSPLTEFVLVLSVLAATYVVGNSCLEVADQSAPETLRGNVGGLRDFMRHCTWFCCSARRSGLILGLPFVFFWQAFMYETWTAVMNPATLGDAYYDITCSDFVGAIDAAPRLGLSCQDACRQLSGNCVTSLDQGHN